MTLFDEPITLESLLARIEALEAEVRGTKPRTRTDCPAEVSEAWGLWNMHRAGKGWTAAAKSLNLKRLCELSTTNGKLNAELALAIVNQAMEKGYRGLFPLKDQPHAKVVPIHKTTKQALAPCETPLERALGRIRQDYHYGVIDEATRDQRVREATQQHRN